jgi:hypothetical protein
MGGELWIISNNVLTHLQNTILMLGTIAFMVKTKIVDGYMKQKTKGIDTHLQLLDILSMFVFIDLFKTLSKDEMPTQL